MAGRRLPRGLLAPAQVEIGEVGVGPAGMRDGPDRLVGIGQYLADPGPVVAADIDDDRADVHEHPPFVALPDQGLGNAAHHAQGAVLAVDLLAVLLAFGDVAEHPGGDPRPAIGMAFGHAAAIFNPQPVAVFVANPVLDDLRLHAFLLDAVNGGGQHRAVVGMYPLDPGGQRARGFVRRAADDAQHAVAAGMAILVVLVFPAAGAAEVERQLEVSFQTQAVAFGLRAVQGVFQALQGQLFEQAALADHAGDAPLVVEDEHVAEAEAVHRLQCAGDRCLDMHAAQRRGHRRAERNRVGVGEAVEQAGNVALGEDADRPLILADDQVIGGMLEHAGDGLVEPGGRRQVGDLAIHDPLQRAQVTEGGAAQVHAEIGVADDAGDLAGGIGDHQVTDALFLDQVAGAVQVHVHGGGDQRRRHDRLDRRVARMARMQRAHDVGFGQDAQRFAVGHHEQAGDVLVGHHFGCVEQRGARGQAAHLAGHDLAKGGLGGDGHGRGGGLGGLQPWKVPVGGRRRMAYSACSRAMAVKRS